MTVGTKSFLVGVHQFFLHPVLVWLAWVRLYGWRRVTCPATGLRVSALNPRLWLAIAVHDLGYLGCDTIDGDWGKWHPVRGAVLVSQVLGEVPARLSGLHELVFSVGRRENSLSDAWASRRSRDLGRWGLLVLLHSRSVARWCRSVPSLLCAADKYSLTLYPRYMYLTLARWSGELDEYMANCASEEGENRGIDVSSPEAWYDSVVVYMRRVVGDMLAGRDAGVPAEDGGTW